MRKPAPKLRAVPAAAPPAETGRSEDPLDDLNMSLTEAFAMVDMLYEFSLASDFDERLETLGSDRLHEYIYALFNRMWAAKRAAEQLTDDLMREIDERMAAAREVRA